MQLEDNRRRSDFLGMQDFDFAQIVSKFSQILDNFTQILPEFAQIYPNFNQICLIFFSEFRKNICSLQPALKSNAPGL